MNRLEKVKIGSCKFLLHTSLDIKFEQDSLLAVNLGDWIGEQ